MHTRKYRHQFFFWIWKITGSSLRRGKTERPPYVDTMSIRLSVTKYQRLNCFRIFMKYGTVVLYKKPSCKGDFREDRFRGNHTLLSGLNAFRPVLPILLHRVCWSPIHVELWLPRKSLQWNSHVSGASISFYSCFPHLFSDMDENRYKNLQQKPF